MLLTRDSMEFTFRIVFWPRFRFKCGKESYRGSKSKNNPLHDRYQPANNLTDDTFQGRVAKIMKRIGSPYDYKKGASIRCGCLSHDVVCPWNCLQRVSPFCGDLNMHPMYNMHPLHTCRYLGECLEVQKNCVLCKGTAQKGLPTSQDQLVFRGQYRATVWQLVWK